MLVDGRGWEFWGHMVVTFLKFYSKYFSSKSQTVIISVILKKNVVELSLKIILIDNFEYCNYALR